ncbi:hypothetical protein [Actinomadura sp. NPDC049753]|uniref:hypothetical protein n=1 Tax=Actinomadura sp. NPDC049753 TaxID=3154739 RepID=UPI0034387433
MTPFGPVGLLCDELRLRVPGLETVLRCDEGRVSSYLKVARPGIEPRVIVWDRRRGVYQWKTGPDAGGQLGADVDQAAVAVAVALGLSIL